MRLVLILVAALVVAAGSEIDDDDEVVPVVLLDSRRLNSTPGRYDEREARMSLVQATESPRSKSRREQVQRSRRRQVPATASRRSGVASPRRRVSVMSMMQADLLEMQESQNGVYVTVPEHNDTHEIVIQTLTGATSSSSRRNPKSSRTTSSTTQSSVGSLEYRGKKTVAMPASLYNHFRPVESNVPIEDMSQFLYFGQKLRVTGKDAKMMMMASPSPKKLLDMLDDEMNSVDRRPGGGMSSKSTKMRTTSLREHTTKPTRPEEDADVPKANSLNSTTTTDKLDAVATNLSLKIVSTTTSTTTEMSTQETPRYTVPTRTKQQQQSSEVQQQQQRQRGSLRNSSEPGVSVASTTAPTSTSTGSSTAASSSSSSSIPSSSTVASVERITSPPSSTPHQPGFTIRWTDARGAKRRRLNPRRRGDKSSTTTSRTTMDESVVVAAETTTTTTTTTTETNDVTTVLATTVKMLDPSEVQKMYRSSTTSTEAPTRSPEVRGRNLASKDDVLPIMRRFNTSSLFNETIVPTATTAEPVTEPIRTTSTTTTTTSTTTTTTTLRPVINRTNTGGYYPLELGGINRTGYVTVQNLSEVTSRRHDQASPETIAIVSYVLASLLVFPVAVGIGLILRRLILRNRKVLEESDTSSEISCRKDNMLSMETGDYKMPIEKTITKLPRIQHLCHEVEKPPPPSSQESRWEFPRDKLRLQTVLGEGNFGQVWKAEADDLTGHQGTTRLVAVKTVKEGASDREKEDLVRELEIMQRVGSHPNVVTLLGCCTEQEPHYLILEYVMYGKLLAYLRDHRTRQDFYNFSEDSAALTSRDLTVFGYCVARGMEYLASKKIIHRDLAARNVLVDHNKLCKIADFGMSRFANEDGEVVETRHGRNALPIRWMAPESLIYSLFTTKTDVWSFGILMWEIVTLGSTPYPDMTAREVMRSVQSSYRLERPSHCRSELFRVIARCWHADPDRRPEFPHLRRDLAQLLEDNMNGHYVDLESFASSECND